MPNLVALNQNTAKSFSSKYLNVINANNMLIAQCTEQNIVQNNTKLPENISPNPEHFIMFQPEASMGQILTDTEYVIITQLC